MKDRYLFRGKCIHNGEWVTGHYVAAEDVTTIIEFTQSINIGNGWADSWVVDPDTIGQCTELRDKHGTLIYEGDIVAISCHAGTKTGEVYWNYAQGRWEADTRMVSDTWRRAFRFTDGSKWCGNLDNIKVALGAPNYADSSCEIIGNIHDNPDLIEEAEEAAGGVQ